jgi:hypothetical protein
MFLSRLEILAVARCCTNWMAQCCPYLVTPHSPPGLEVNIKSSTSSRGQQYVCGKVWRCRCGVFGGCVCSPYEGNRLGEFRQPCTTPPGVREPRSVREDITVRLRHLGHLLVSSETYFIVVLRILQFQCSLPKLSACLRYTYGVSLP